MRVFRNPGHTISSFLAPIPQKPNNTDWRRNGCLKQAHLPYLNCNKERNLSFCTLYGVWGDKGPEKFHFFSHSSLFQIITAL